MSDALTRAQVEKIVAHLQSGSPFLHQGNYLLAHDAAQRAEIVRLTDELIKAGQSYDRGYQQGLDDGHRCERRHKTIDVLETENAALKERVRELVKFYDDHVGTPCEQIRHEQTVTRLREIAKQFAEHIKKNIPQCWAGPNPGATEQAAVEWLQEQQALAEAGKEDQ